MRRLFVTVIGAAAVGGVAMLHGYLETSDARQKATRQVLLLRLPKEEEDRFMEVLRVSGNEEEVKDTLEKAKAMADEIVKHGQPAKNLAQPSR